MVPSSEQCSVVFSFMGELTTSIDRHCTSFKDRLNQFKQQMTSTSLAALLCLTGGGLVGQSVFSPPVQAYTSRVDVVLDVLPEETYETLLRRAEAVARAATQRSFDRDILVTDVSVVITAQNRSSIVPILTLTATRSQWQGRPDPRNWATYYTSARGLLGLTATPLIPITSVATAPTQRPASTTERSGVRNSKQAPRRSTSQKARRGAGVTSRASTTSRPTKKPLIPERIPTPGRVGR